MTQKTNHRIKEGIIGLLIALIGLGIMFIINEWWILLIGAIPTIIGATIIGEAIFGKIE